MLTIPHTASTPIWKILLWAGVLLLVAGGSYVASLWISPAIAHAFFIKPVAVNSLEAPVAERNRLVIPSLGIDIPYATGTSSLDSGAQWRQPERGNPSEGGTMLLMAHRLSVQNTPTQTIARSPFYSLSTLSREAKLVIDYDGIRYGYQVISVTTGATADTLLPTDTDQPRLVLYTYDSDHDTRRTVVVATPLGKVAL